MSFCSFLLGMVGLLNPYIILYKQLSVMQLQYINSLIDCLYLIKYKLLYGDNGVLIVNMAYYVSIFIIWKLVYTDNGVTCMI